MYNLKYFLHILFLFFSYIVLGQADSILYKNDDLKIFKSKALYKDILIYNNNKDYRELKKNEGDCAEGTQFIYTPLSLIGEYYSFEKATIDYGGSGGCYRSPSSYAKIVSLNLNTKDTLSVLDLVEETSLLKALKQDPWIQNQENIDFKALQSSQTLDTILKIINESTSEYGEMFSKNSFAVAGYNSENQKLYIRLIKLNYMGYNHFKFLQLGLMVSPLEKTKERLKRRNNFYMGAFEGQLLN